MNGRVRRMSESDGVDDRSCAMCCVVYTHKIYTCVVSVDVCFAFAFFLAKRGA